MTASEIVLKALRRIGVVASDEAATADQASNGLAELNAMMFGWKAYSVDVEHVKLNPGDATTIGVEYDEAVSDLLAARLAVDYGRPAPSANYAWKMMQAKFLVVPDATFDDALLDLPSRVNSYF